MENGKNAFEMLQEMPKPRKTSKKDSAKEAVKRATSRMLSYMAVPPAEIACRNESELMLHPEPEHKTFL